MSASFEPTTDSPLARLYDAADRYAEDGGSSDPSHRLPEPARAEILRNVTTDGADIDISDPVFDFVRSIRVLDVDWSHFEIGDTDPRCLKLRSRLRIGTYGLQGDFAWRNGEPDDVQGIDEAWFGFRTRSDGSCSNAGRFRGVGVEWRDHEGNRGSEVVRY